MLKNRLYIILFILIFAISFRDPFAITIKLFGKHDSLSIRRIAHAGGGLNGEIYTNSYEALNLNYSKGYEFFEIDFDWTQDGKLVSVHDWEEKFESCFGFSVNQRPILELFNFWVEDSARFHLCTPSGLSVWLKKHPNAKLITDVKNDNIKALEAISAQIEDFQEKVIPQIYYPHEYERVKKLGYKNIIWTLYRCRRSNEEVLRLVKNMDLFAVTMPPERAIENLGLDLKKFGVGTYVHTINTEADLEMFQNTYAITEVYTDFLAAN